MDFKATYVRTLFSGVPTDYNRLLRTLTFGQDGIWRRLGFALFVVVETIFALAYNLECFNGRFHTNAWFAFSWGALPFLTSLFLQDGHLPIWSLAIAAALSATAIVQISLSRWIKGYRRGPDVQSTILSEERLDLDTPAMIARPQRDLRTIVWVVDLLAVCLVLRRITA